MAEGDDVLPIFEPEEEAILARIRQSESGGRYNILAGGGSFQGYDKFPEWAGMLHPYQGRMVRSHGAGAYQFEPGTWRAQAAKLGLGDFSPQNQDLAALDLAKTTYSQNTGGRDILADQKAGKVQWSALQPQWIIGGDGSGAPRLVAQMPTLERGQPIPAAAGPGEISSGLAGPGGPMMALLPPSEPPAAAVAPPPAEATTPAAGLFASNPLALMSLLGLGNAIRQPISYDPSKIGRLADVPAASMPAVPRPQSHVAPRWLLQPVSFDPFAQGTGGPSLSAPAYVTRTGVGYG